MEKQKKCKNCGKEVSIKAEICPNCGVRIKQNPTIKNFTIILLIIIVVFVIILSGIIIVDINNEKRRKSYVGTWKLMTKEKMVSVKFDETYKIILDNELIITNDNSYYSYGMNHGPSYGCYGNKKFKSRCKDYPPFIQINRNDNTIGINFIETYGRGVLLCFKRNKDTIKQIKCEHSNTNEYDGILNEQFDIVYKKIK